MQIAILLYDKFTALDAIVPYEVSPWAVLLRMWKLTGRPGRPGQGLPPAPGWGALCSAPGPYIEVETAWSLVCSGL